MAKKHGKKQKLPRCDKCHRPMPASELRATAIGNRCEMCANKLPPRLRRPTVHG